MNLFQKALHLAAKKIIVKEQVTPEVASERYNVCMTCDKRDESLEKCRVCGCFLDLKTSSAVNWNAMKGRNEITHCPLGKWGDVDTANMYRQMDGAATLNT